MREVTFREFAKLMDKRKRTVDDLCEVMRGKIEDARGFFERVMSCKWRNPETGRYEDCGDVVIPYACVIEFYRKELAHLKDLEAEYARQAEARKRGPVSEDRRRQLVEQLNKSRLSRK